MLLLLNDKMNEKGLQKGTRQAQRRIKVPHPCSLPQILILWMMMVIEIILIDCLMFAAGLLC